MKRLLSAALALVLALTLALPALAWETSPEKYASFDEYLAFYRAQEDPETQSLVRFLDAYLAGRPDAVAALDPHAYFEANIASDAGVNIENWFAWQTPDYTEAHFRAEMMDVWLTELYRKDVTFGLEDFDPTFWQHNGYSSLDAFLYAAQITHREYEIMVATMKFQQTWGTAYITAHPDEIANFDADAFYEQNYGFLGAIDDFMKRQGLDAPAFHAQMLNTWVGQQYYIEQLAILSEGRPEIILDDYINFDVNAWFQGCYGDTYGITKRQYMEAEGIWEEDFRLRMFEEFYTGARGRYNGITVLLDGVPVQFQMVRDASGEIAAPLYEDGRILVPLRTISQAADFSVEYDADARTALCTKNGVSVLFTLNSDQYTVAAGSETRSLALEVPARAENGRTYVPLRALGEALGYTVDWSGTFQTAVLTTNPDKD